MGETDYHHVLRGQVKGIFLGWHFYKFLAIPENERHEEQRCQRKRRQGSRQYSRRHGKIGAEVGTAKKPERGGQSDKMGKSISPV